MMTTNNATLRRAARVKVLTLLDAPADWAGCDEVEIEELARIDDCRNAAASEAPRVVLVSGALLPDAEPSWVAAIESLAGPIVVVADQEAEEEAARGSGVTAVLPRSFLNASGDLAAAILADIASRSRARRDDPLRFMRDAIHEFRTPLTTMVEFTSLMRDGIGGPLEPRQETYLDYVLAASERQLEQFDDYRDGLRIEHSDLRVKPQRVDLAELLDEALALTGRPADLRGLGADAEVRVDPELYLASVRRLVDAARKLGSRDASIAISVRRQGTALETWIEYDGPAPSEDDCEVMRAGFVERDGYTRSLARVFGLGVALAERFARTCGGRLELAPRDAGESGGRFALSLGEKR